MDLKYLAGVLRYVISTLLSIGLAVFLLYHIAGSFRTEVTAASIVYTTQEQAQDFDAYIFRSEYLLYTAATESGGLNHLREDGAKVAVGEEICQVYAGTSDESANLQLQELDRTLERLKNSNLKENVNYSDTQLIDASINNTYYTILTRLNDGNMGYAMAKADDLISSMNQRLIITKHVENFDEQIGQLEGQRSALVNSGGEVAETVYAPRSGYYFADIDGFEGIFDADRLDNMTIEEFDTLISSSADAALGRNALGGLSCGKIVTDYNWYVGCRITTEQSRSFTEGYTYTVIFPYNSDIRISMVLDRMILQADDDRVVLVFRTNVIPEHFNFLRRQSIQIVVNTYHGYKVPLAAVRIQDGVQGVYILEGYVVKFRRIEPLQEIEGYFICRENSGSSDDADLLALYDRIIVSGKNLYVGKIIS